jgi:hypothetical protein
VPSPAPSELIRRRQLSRLVSWSLPEPNHAAAGAYPVDG